MKVDKDMKIEQENAGNAAQEAGKDEKIPAGDPGAISRQQIDEWKGQHGRVYQTVIGPNVFVWRRVKRGEYVDAMTDGSLSDDADRRIYERQENILRKVCLYPSGEALEKLIDEEGCLATCLANEIMDRSGFSLPVTSQVI